MIEPRLRIGELSRRLGVSPQLLRAWERRYDLFDPQRSDGGYRLYSAEDERRARLLLGHLAEGCSTAEAARLARSAPANGVETAAPSPDALARVRATLVAALAASDEARAQSALDELFAITDLEGALAEVVLPALSELGRRWAAGEISVATEHYATSILQSRLLALARGWDQGTGPQAILACAPDEQHALGLVAFGLVLRRRGWRIAYLGPNTPMESVDEWVQRLAPAAVIEAALLPERFEAVRDELRALAARVPLVLGGKAATPELAAAVGARCSEPELVATADMVAREFGR